MMLVPLALYLSSLSARARFEVEDFFASGRRVPPVFNGFVLAAVAVGGVGFLAYTGTVFFLGFDALAIGLGWTFGMFARRHPVRALFAQGRLLYAAELSRPPLSLARVAHGGQRDAAPADRAAACSPRSRSPR